MLITISLRHSEFLAHTGPQATFACGVLELIFSKAPRCTSGVEYHCITPKQNKILNIRLRSLALALYKKEGAGGGGRRKRKRRENSPTMDVFSCLL